MNEERFYQERERQRIGWLAVYDALLARMPAGAEEIDNRVLPYQAEVTPPELMADFWDLFARISLPLQEDTDQLYGYFLMGMKKEIRLTLTAPTATSFQGMQYVLYVNPLLFLACDAESMRQCLQHEILHILSLHPIRLKALEKEYDPAVVAMAMDVTINSYLPSIPEWYATLGWVNRTYHLHLKPYRTFEYYAEEIQKGLDLTEAESLPDADGGQSQPTPVSEEEVEENSFLPLDLEHLHDMWRESDPLEEGVWRDVTSQLANQAARGQTSAHVQALLDAMTKPSDDRPWYQLLQQLVGQTAGRWKRSSVRRNRRQPERLDLSGRLRSYVARITVAIDISGSITDGAFRQALEQVLAIVDSYDHEVTVIECDYRIRRQYVVKDKRDIQRRLDKRGSTAFSPVIAYCNQHKPDMLLYVTDGQGEEILRPAPKGYPILWLLSGEGELSLRRPYGTVKRLQLVDASEDTEYERVSGFSMANQEK